MTPDKQKERAAARLIAIGVDFDSRHGFGGKPALVAPPRKRNIKNGITAAIHGDANGVLRRSKSTGRYAWQEAA